MKMKTKLVTLAALVALFMAVPATYTYIDAKPAKKTATKKKTSTSSAKPFKGYWYRYVSPQDHFIDIDLYNKKYNSQFGGYCYGTFGSVGMRKIDEHYITDVISISGNTAIVESECSYSGETFRGKFTYNPSTGRMSYTNISGDGYECYSAGLESLPRAKKR